VQKFLYILQFNCELPDETTIRRAAHKFCQTGTVADKDRPGRPTIRDDHAESASNLLMQGASVRTAAAVEGLNCAVIAAKSQ